MSESSCFCYSGCETEGIIQRVHALVASGILSDRRRSDAPCCAQLLSNTQCAASSCTQISSLLVGLFSNDAGWADLGSLDVTANPKFSQHAESGRPVTQGGPVAQQGVLFVGHWNGLSSRTITCEIFSWVALWLTTVVRIAHVPWSLSAPARGNSSIPSYMQSAGTAN